MILRDDYDEELRISSVLLQIPTKNEFLLVSPTNVEVRATTGCRPLSHLVTDRCLRLFGHIARSSPQEDHHRAVAAVIRGLPSDWKRPLGRPSHTWFRAVEADLGQQNIGLASAWRKVAIHDDWRRIVDTATLQRSTL